MNTNTTIEPPVPTRRKLRIFSLYADFAAGVRAKRLAARIAASAGAEWHTISEMWTLNSVGPIGIVGEIIGQEAGESDVLLIASSSAQHPEPAIRSWLASLANWKANRLVPGLLIGLLGDGETELPDGVWLARQLTAFAQRTRMDIGWQIAGRDAGQEFQALAPKLDTLLSRKEQGLG